MTVEPLRAGKQCELILKFTNPTQHQTVITLLATSFEDPEVYEENEAASQPSDDSEQISVSDTLLLFQIYIVFL